MVKKDETGSKGISVASKKSKARILQQLVRDKIIQMLKPWGILPEDVKSTSMGAGGQDVQLSPLAKSFLPVATECKSHKSMAVYKLYEQAKANCGPDEEPLLVVKQNHSKPLAVVDLDYYFKLEWNRIMWENR